LGGLRGAVCTVPPRCRSASLPRSLGARSFARLGRRAGRLGCLPFKCNPRWLAPAEQLPPGLACSGFSPAGFRFLRRQPFQQFCPSGRSQLILYAVVVPSRQKPARLVVMRRDLHSVVPFQQIIAPHSRGSCFLTSRFAGRQKFSFCGLPQKENAHR